MEKKKFKEIGVEEAAFRFIINYVERGVKKNKKRYEFKLTELKERQEILQRPGGADLFFGFCYGIDKKDNKAFMKAVGELCEDAETTVVGPELPIQNIKKEIELWFKYWDNTERYIRRGYTNYTRK